MAVKIQSRRGTSVAWTEADPLLLAGEIGVETDTGKFKIGDGETPWTDLSYATSAIQTQIDGIQTTLGGVQTELAAKAGLDGGNVFSGLQELFPTDGSDQHILHATMLDQSSGFFIGQAASAGRINVDYFNVDSYFDGGGSFNVESTVYVDFGTAVIHNIGDGVEPGDAVNKEQLDTKPSYVETTTPVVFDTGIFTGGSAQTATAVIRRTGKVVNVELPTVAATTNNTSELMSTSGTPLSDFAPAADCYFPLMVSVGGGTISIGFLVIKSTGAVQVYFSTDGVAPIAGGATGVGYKRIAVAYTLA